MAAGLGTGSRVANPVPSRKCGSHDCRRQFFLPGVSYWVAGGGCRRHRCRASNGAIRQRSYECSMVSTEVRLLKYWLIGVVFHNRKRLGDGRGHVCNRVMQGSKRGAGRRALSSCEGQSSRAVIAAQPSKHFFLQGSALPKAVSSPSFLFKASCTKAMYGGHLPTPPTVDSRSARQPSAAFWARLVLYWMMLGV